jgi:hypothetical protein
VQSTPATRAVFEGAHDACLRTARRIARSEAKARVSLAYLRTDLKSYRRALRLHGDAAAGASLVGAVGIVLWAHPLVLPAWFWFLLTVASAFWIGFVAFRDANIELLSLRYDARAGQRRDCVETLLDACLTRLDARVGSSGIDADTVPLVAEMNRASTLVGAAIGPMEAMKLHVPEPADPTEFIARLRDMADRFPTLQVRPDFDPREMQEAMALQP